jgi:membrane-bound lytic murein transglycosylase B
MTDKQKLSKTLEWYARDADSPGLRNALNDAADALASAAKRDAAEAEVERLISEAYQ